MNLLGFQNPYSDETTQLLGLDPREMRRQAIFQGLMQAGAGLAATGNIGGAALGLARGINDGREQYMEQALLGYRAKRNAEDDAWRKQDQEWKRQEQQQRSSWLQSLPENQRGFAQAFPGAYASQYAQTLFPSAPQLTDDMREWEYAQQNPEFAQWMQRGGQAELPKGYRWKQDGTGAEPIPGVMVSGAPKPYNPSSSDRTAIRNASDENVVLQQTLENLDEAKNIVGDTNSGWFASPRASVAENLPDSMVPDMVFGSPKQGEATNRFKQIMDAEALASMGKLLKGPTSDRDVSIMLRTVNDPNASIKRKQASIDRVRNLIQAQLDQNTEMIQGVKDGSYYGIGAASAPTPQIFTTEDGYTIEPLE